MLDVVRGNETCLKFDYRTIRQFFPPHKYTLTHTDFRLSCITFSHERERKRQRKEEKKEREKTVDFFLFRYQTNIKKLYFFAPLFNFYPKQFVQGPCVPWIRPREKNVLLFCVALSALRRELVKPVFCFRVIGIIRPPHPTFRVPIHPIPVISTRDCAHFEPFPLYSTFRYSSSCFPRWFICV